jgi:hypothetical protein
MALITFTDVGSMRDTISGLTVGTDTVFLDAEVGGGFFTVTSASTGPVDGGMVIAKATDPVYYFNRILEDDQVISAQYYFIAPNDPDTVDSTALTNFLTYCKDNSKTVYFPEGTYEFPSDFEFDFGTTPFKLVGDGRDKTIITTSASLSVRYAEKVDITSQKPFKPGIYQVDVVGPTIHSDFSSLGLALGDYVQVTSGTCSKINDFAEVKSAGYVTDLDITTSSGATQAGLYVVSNTNVSFSGGSFYPMAEPAWMTGPSSLMLGYLIDVTSGTTSMVHTRYDASRGFIFRGDAHIEGLKFNDVSFYIFSHFYDTVSKKMEKNMLLRDCSFSNCTRVFSVQAYGGPNGKVDVDPQETYPNGSGVYKGFAFNSFEISHCEFDNIHTSILWYTPYTRNWIIRNNIVRDCYNAVALFFYHADDAYRHNVCQVEGNTFVRCRNYGGPVVNGGKVMVRTPGKALVSNNTALSCNGIHFYTGGPNNKVFDNYVEPYQQTYATEGGNNSLVFWFKTNGTSGSLDELYNNTVYGGIKTTPVGIRKNSNLIIRDNTIRTGLGRNYITNYSNVDLDKKQSYDFYYNSTLGTSGSLNAVFGSGNYDPVLTASSAHLTLYYNERENIWKARTNPGEVGAIVFDQPEYYGPVELIEIKNNIIESDLLFVRAGAGDAPLAKLVITNNRLDNFVALLQDDITDYVEITDNPNISLHSYRANYMVAKKGLLFRNNVVRTSFLGSLMLKCDEDIVADGNRFLPYPDFDDFSVFGQSRATYDAVLFMNAGGNIRFENNFVSARHARHTGVVVETFTGDLDIANNSFDLTIPVTTFTKRIAAMVFGTSGSSSIYLVDNEATFDDDAANTNTFVLLKESTSHRYINVKLVQNTVTGPRDAHHLVKYTDSGTSLLIDKLYLGKNMPGSSSAIASTYLSSINTTTNVTTYYDLT